MRDYLTRGELAKVLSRDWCVEPDELADLLDGRGEDRTTRLLSSILSGPIDVDKMDYLMRDSLHAGVPYGRHFDQTRLIGSLCLNLLGGAEDVLVHVAVQDSPALRAFVVEHLSTRHEVAHTQTSLVFEHLHAPTVTR